MLKLLCPVTHVREALWLARAGRRSLTGLLNDLHEVEPW